VTDVLAGVRAHLRSHFTRAGVDAEPQTAGVTFLGVDPIDVLRFGPGSDGIVHYVSVGCSRNGMGDDPVSGPRAEVTVSLRERKRMNGLARSVATLAAAPAVEGLLLTADALVDLGQPLWRGAAFTAFLLGHSEIQAAAGVEFIRAIPITANEAAWVRLKGVDAMRQAWHEDGVDVADPVRSASAPS
jgi:hypothetical protein